MKKILAIVLALMMILSLAACGGDTPPSGGGTTPPSGGGTTPPSGGTDTNIPDPGETRVETKSDRIVTTFNDGAGSIAVTEYIYKNGALSEIIMTMQCAEAAYAQALLDSYTTGSLKEYGDELFSDMRLDGKNVVFTYKYSYLESFTAFTMDQLADILNGGDPISGGGTGGNPGGDAGEPAINTVWEDMNLPDGFPKLADGVTSYMEFDGGAMLSWDVMSLADLETMMSQLEDWSGLTIEKTFEMDGAVCWGVESDNLVITINYWPDAVDLQASIMIQQF